jgi:hypothetical protein
VPGALYYCLYTYAIYLIGAPFSILILLYALLVGLSAFTTLALMAVIDRAAVQERLAPTMPVRPVGGLLVIPALVTLAQDASGVISTSRAAGVPLDPPPRPVWAADLTIEVPAVLLGGILLWRRTALGCAAGAGLLLQYGLTPLALAAGMVLQAVAAGSAVDPAAVGVLAFAVMCFAPLTFFARAARSPAQSQDQHSRMAVNRRERRVPGA